MLLPIADLLDAPSLLQIRETLSTAPRYNGARSAGWAAQAVKHNQQFEPGEPLSKAQAMISAALAGHPLLQLAARPARYSPVLFNAYQDGGSYGLHTDDAFMAGLRTDLSYTLFLSDPASYEGGELLIHDHAGTQSFKLDAGALLLYPADTLHEVSPVLRGERLAAVGWLQSQVQDASARALLFDLELVRRHLHTREPGSSEFLRLSRVCGVLIRRWSASG